MTLRRNENTESQTRATARDTAPGRDTTSGTVATSQQQSPQRWRGQSARFFPGIPTPWEMIQNVSQELNLLMQSLGSPQAGGAGVNTPASVHGLPVWLPRIETVRNSNEFVVRAELPGVNTDDIKLSVDDGVLTISGERRQEERLEQDGVIRTERVYGSFQRSVPLPDGADEDRITATFRDGVLEVKIPVTTRTQGREIKIER
jgi:HSP20 family protein